MEDIYDGKSFEKMYPQWALGILLEHCGTH
jgi:hypothetical protein